MSLNAVKCEERTGQRMRLPHQCSITNVPGYHLNGYNGMNQCWLGTCGQRCSVIWSTQPYEFHSRARNIGAVHACNAAKMVQPTSMREFHPLSEKPRARTCQCCKVLRRHVWRVENCPKLLTPGAVLNDFGMLSATGQKCHWRTPASWEREREKKKKREREREGETQNKKR